MLKIKNEVEMINEYILMTEDYLYRIDEQTFEQFWYLK